MEDEREIRPPECYNFPGFRDIWKKKNKSRSSKRHNDHKNHKNKIKPSNESHDEDIFKAVHEKRKDAKNYQMNEVKKLGRNGSNGVEERNKINQNDYDYDYDDLDHRNHYSPNSCFKAFILFSASKKKQMPSRVSSASDIPDHARKHRAPSRARSLETKPSLAKSRSINRSSKSENWTKAPNNSRTASLNRTASMASSKANSFNGRNNGSFVNRTTSVGRSRSDVAKSLRKMNISRSGPLIMFSNSKSGVLKPPPIEQQLECTLEELCHGCLKRINVTRDVYTRTGQIIQEEEVLTVKVKPGWRTGTKITFEGTASEDRPGQYPADIIFIITEKHHPLYRRNEDDLELEIEIPLVDALTGCTLTIPLLGNGKMSMAIDDIVYPGYEKVIVGQGMPDQKKPEIRGYLKVKFLVEFPRRLRDDQRSEISTILSGC